MQCPKSGFVIVDVFDRWDRNSGKRIIVKNFNNETNSESQINREVGIGEFKNKLQNV
jgi:hypothetical protein